MNKTELEIRKKYRYSILSYVFDIYMECEFRANLTQEVYEGLSPGEFRFDYESWGRRLGFSKKQIERAIKELTTESVVIEQKVRGHKGTCSKYFLTRFQENNKEHNKANEKRMINIDNTCIIEGVGEQKENNKENKKEHSSQHKYLNIISNNIYSHWNTKKIIVHKSLTNDMNKAIEKALKKYSEEEIIQGINNYADILNSDYYFNYRWSMTDFLNRKNGISTFMEEGNNKVNYDIKIKGSGKNENTKRNTYGNGGMSDQDKEEFNYTSDNGEGRQYTDREREESGLR